LSAIVNTAAVNMGVHVSISVMALISLGYIPRSEIAESYGTSISRFLKKHQIDFQSSCTILHSY
ncbi:hypothetical protein NG726_40585, partial [Pseudomonas sp. MOB-449]|nr:hypothetical protein [Pseudomonas sp. MOB-449]